jgi:predicted solute-binding protein
MAPYREQGPPDGCAFIDLIPRESIAALQQKRVWAAAVPVGGLHILGGRVRFLGRYGIAARSEVMSVLFFADHPFEEFRRPMTIHLTGESASSVRLLYLLLGYRHGFREMPLIMNDAQARADGALRIGDTALHWAWQMKQNGSADGYRHVTDLAEQWNVRHGLPFVFARWVIHTEAPPSLYDTLMTWLERFREHEQDLIDQSGPKVAGGLGLPLDYVTRYLRVIRRCLTPDDDAGQALFRKELERHAADPLFAPYCHGAKS